MRDIANNIRAAEALAPAVQAAAANGPAIDLLGFNSVAFIVTTGAIVGAGDFAVKLQESDDGTNFTDADASVVTSNAPATLAGSATYKLGYRGFCRYTRLALTKAGGTSIALGAVAILGHAHDRPVS